MNSVSHHKPSSYEVKRQLHTITYSYTQELEQIMELLRDARDYLEHKKIKEIIDENSYLIRMRGLVGMALVYFYSKLEGFTRSFFAQVLHYEIGMTREQFNVEFHKFHDLRKKIIQERYHIRFPKRSYELITLLRKERNDMVHLDRKVKPVFENIELCARGLLEYFQIIKQEIFSRLR